VATFVANLLKFSVAKAADADCVTSRRGHHHATYIGGHMATRNTARSRSSRPARVARQPLQRTGDAKLNDVEGALYGIAAIVDALADRLNERGSLGEGEQRGHDVGLVMLLERECARAIEVVIARR
jgi:hypothetical protein